MPVPVELLVLPFEFFAHGRCGPHGHGKARRLAGVAQVGGAERPFDGMLGDTVAA